MAGGVINYWWDFAKDGWLVEVRSRGRPIKTFGIGAGFIGRNREDLLLKFLRGNPDHFGHDIVPLARDVWAMKQKDEKPKPYIDEDATDWI